MRAAKVISYLVLPVFSLLLPTAVFATDVDGPDDCIQNRIDEGDAPEGIPAYATGVPGHFPTCVSLYFAAGTQELACPAISSPPGPTGYMEHFQFPSLPPFWLGCFPALGPLGVDNEFEGKVSAGFPAGMPAPPGSACGTVGVDCIETAGDGMKFGQDECYGDGSDAGIASLKSFVICTFDAVSFSATSCPSGQGRTVFLNILVDWNADGDWNDNFLCPTSEGCAYEWAVKNAAIDLLPGCNAIASPSFLTGPKAGPGWMRLSLTDSAVPDDYPWAGAAGDGGGAYEGGETEDYPVMIEGPTPTDSRSWGSLKAHYR